MIRSAKSIANSRRVQVAAAVVPGRSGYYPSCERCGRRGPEVLLSVARRLALAHRCPDSFETQIETIELPE